MATSFEWDEAKAASNTRKHGLSFVEATAVFLDPALIETSAFRAQDGEVRQKSIGRIGNRLFAVVFFIRGEARRLISARRANGSEERIYGDRQTQA